MIEKGLIPLAGLFTIRKGEPARDNVKGGLMQVTTDIIKIKGKGASWTCSFLEKQDNSCTIYPSRPIECRVLTCWDTREIERIYAVNRLTREDLLTQMASLWDLVNDHQAKCSYETLNMLAPKVGHPSHGGAGKSILDMLRYDVHLRHVVVEKGGMDAGMLEFLFGRPMTSSLAAFDLSVSADLTWLRRIDVKRQSP